ncbi:54S ribosomal protein L6 mitochondrial [Yamadazyma tenuis]|uniref:Ribosomal protein L6 n=1 Tax=Candida tenuis (strain ATCC 10573 / BCRC 21748 / CBS 615 / JCM 9827 / NBRC 10315 / NRRL Y-1498 / VKM Y-70) TaxID=590646 RepID=G3BFV2_CANTC|nr:ribosomal protein L6 [Yamadazyma tenuis ATCC 10573]EGV60738.1 ribosomal protein L6 [Yamadazyma tenuis ATCC 10573]WEJ93993.1 54S ribosomal protein L6 mitochondrial [Yamadazyma tenuis]
MFKNGGMAVATSSRYLSTSCTRFSNIGRQPIRIGSDVECATYQIPYEFCKTFTKGKDTINLDQQVVIKGPKGVMKLALPGFVKVLNENDLISVSVEDPTNKIQRAMWGTSRALIQNNVIGTSEGHLAVLRFVGTGYRALLETDENGTKVVALKLGYPYTPKLRVPVGLTVSSPNPARLLIEGVDKQQVKLFAARIREFKKPEPYKGKGIFVDGESIHLKEKKIK